MKPWWSRLRPDNFTLALLCTVLLASLLPMHGAAAMVLDDVTDVGHCRCCSSCTARGCRVSRSWPGCCTGACT